MNPDHVVPGLSITYNQLFLWLLGFWSLIGLLDAIGLIPPPVAKWLNRNKTESILRALKQLGVQITWSGDSTSRLTPFRRVLAAVGKKPAYKVRLAEMIAEDSYSGVFEVGQGNHFEHDVFVDVMGASVCGARAEKYARLLNSHITNLTISQFDLIACPKAGSPLLAYEFAKIRKLPLVLGPDSKVHAKTDMSFHDKLDFPRTLELKGRRVLLVDDSTTGGRKLVTLAETLRDAGAEVDTAVVLFEPLGKGARELLKNAGIALHSVQPGPRGRR